ncbi:MAG: DUF2510 domain-containing protein [Propioniciclava sp.]
MTSAPGWFPDPGGSGRLRFWDGHQWTPQLADQSGAPAPSAPATRQRSPWGWVALAAVLVVALIVGSIAAFTALRPQNDPAPGTPALPAASSTPTISGWDELDTPPPSPTAPPPSTPPPPQPDTDTVPCDNVIGSPTSQSGTPIVGGGLSYPRPQGWELAALPVSRLLTDSVTLYRPTENAPWLSTIEVGFAPGFDDEKTAAQTVLNCYFTSSVDNGHESSETLMNEAITLDGQSGWWLKARESNTRVPGTYAILHAIAIDTGDPEGMRVFWTTAYEVDPQAVDDAEQARDALRLVE